MSCRGRVHCRGLNVLFWSEKTSSCGFPRAEAHGHMQMLLVQMFPELLPMHLFCCAAL